MSVQQADWTGQHLCNGRYLVKHKLGEGGMAMIYLAQDLTDKHPVVVKVPRPEMLADKEFAARFIREIRSMTQLSHPHILKIFDVGQHHGHPFAVLQYLPGGTLRDRQQHKPDGLALPMPPETLHIWLADVAAALDYMHQHGYLHRDIKPENLLFDEQGTICLGDFGIAKVISDQRPETQRTVLTQLGTTIGTPPYMAPELILAHKFDQRVDQYALAVMVYQLLSGRYPFAGINPTQVFEAQLRSTPPALHTLTLTIPPVLSAAVEKALSKEPKSRFPTCAAFADAVLGALANRAAQSIPPAVSAATKASLPTPAESKPAKQIVCSHCGLLQSMPPKLPPGTKVRCRKCQAAFAPAVGAAAKLVKQQKAEESQGPPSDVSPAAITANETAKNDTPKRTTRNYREMAVPAAWGLVVGMLLIFIPGYKGIIPFPRKDLSARIDELSRVSAEFEKAINSFRKQHDELEMRLRERKEEIAAWRKKEKELLMRTDHLTMRLKEKEKEIWTLQKTLQKDVKHDKPPSKYEALPGAKEGDLFISADDFDKTGDFRRVANDVFPETATLSLNLGEEQKQYFKLGEVNKGKELQISIRVSGDGKSANKFIRFFTIKLRPADAESSKLALRSDTILKDIPEATMKYLENNKLLLKIMNKQDELKSYRLAWKTPEK
jgi:serine/threonine-protein kinase